MNPTPIQATRRSKVESGELTRFALPPFVRSVSTMSTNDELDYAPPIKGSKRSEISVTVVVKVIKKFEPRLA
jgi:hypothetical protein